MAIRYTGNFRCVVMSPKGLLFQGEIKSLFVRGDIGEYELLAYHYPLIGIVNQSELLINWEKRIKVRKGVVRFFANECTVLVEEEFARQPEEESAE